MERCGLYRLGKLKFKARVLLLFVLSMILLCLLLFIRSKPKSVLIVVENDYEIDLAQLDSVRENLNGFWVPEKRIDTNMLLYLDFNRINNLSGWDHSTVYNDINGERTFSYASCQPIVEIIKINDLAYLKFISLFGSDTTRIEFLSKTKFKINQSTYLKHRGYDFLQSK